MLGRLNGDIGMQVVRGADVDRINVVSSNKFPPVGLDPLIAPAVGKGLGLFGIPGGNSLQHRLVFQVEKILHAVVAIGMGPPHKPIANHANAKWLCHCVTSFRQSCQFQPWASRTAIMVLRMVFQVAGSSSVALGNMQPSQQMCSMQRAAASSSQ